MTATIHPGGEIPELFKKFGIDIEARWMECRTMDQVQVVGTKARIEAKANYLKQALSLHPDRGGDGEKLKEVNAAWGKLSKADLTQGVHLGPKSAMTIQAAAERVKGTPFVTFVGIAFDPGAE